MPADLPADRSENSHTAPDLLRGLRDDVTEFVGRIVEKRAQVRAVMQARQAAAWPEARPAGAD
ncbi:MAG TPA: hypothetical protein VEB20_24450 [Azospirillaceae bacterium]|nr:hypothetical protein [Azospirillaceae bacterium]